MASVKAKATKVMLSERAVFARVDRALVKRRETIRRCREDARGFHDLGRYYTVDTDINAVTHKGFELESFARKLGVLQPYEAMA